MNNEPSSPNQSRPVNRFDSVAVVGVIISAQKASLDSDGRPVLDSSGRAIFNDVSDFSQEGDGFSAEISYTVRYNDPRYGVPVNVVRVYPVNTRWPKPLRIQAAKPGTGVIGIMLSFNGGSPPIAQFTIHELPGVRLCGSSSGSIPRSIPPITPPPGTFPPGGAQ